MLLTSFWLTGPGAWVSDRWKALVGIIAAVAILGGVGVIALKPVEASPTPGPMAAVLVVPQDRETSLLGLPADATAALTAMASDTSRPAPRTVDVVPVGGSGETQSIDLTAWFGEDPATRQPDTDPARIATKVAAAVDGLVTTVTGLRATDRARAGLYDALVTAATMPSNAIVIIGRAVSTTDPLDLRITGLDVPTGRIVKRLAAAGAVPDLTGKSITLVLADGAGRQERLGLKRTWVEDLWVRLAQAGGATSVTVSWLPVATPPKDAPHAPAIDIPDLSTADVLQAQQKCSVTSAAFLPDTATFRNPPAAAGQARACVNATPGARYTVDGYTHPVPGGGEGLALSAQRADAVAALLVDAGAPRSSIRTHAYGSTRRPPAGLPGGRRVVVVTPSLSPNPR